MIRKLPLLAIALALVGCQETTAPTASRMMADPIPSGNQAPRMTVTVVAGTKAAPVDTPVVRVAWEHQDSVMVGFTEQMFRATGDSIFVLDQCKTKSEWWGQPAGGGSIDLKIPCVDSARIYGSIYTKTFDNPGLDTVRVYCK